MSGTARYTCKMVFPLYISGMKSLGKINFSIFALLVFCLLLAGCQWFASQPPPKVEKIDKNTLLRVGVAIRPPFVIKDEKKQLSGLDIELLELLSQEKGFKLELVEYPLEELVFAVRRGEVDIIAAGFTEQELEDRFLTPCAKHLKTGQRVIANAEIAPFITDKSQLNNEKVTIYTVVGTTATEKANEVFPDAEHASLKDTRTCIKKTLGGKGNVFMLEARDAHPIVADPKLGLSLVLGVLSDEHIAWGIRRKEKERCKQLDEFMQSLRNSGQLQQVIEKTKANKINQ